MILRLYNNNSAKNKINKNLDWLRDVDFSLLSFGDTFSLQTSEPLNANYCYIPEKEMYFFIKDTSKSSLYTYDFSLDYLMTYKSELLSSKLQITATVEPSYNSSSLPVASTYNLRKIDGFKSYEGQTLIISTLGNEALN